MGWSTNRPDQGHLKKMHENKGKTKTGMGRGYLDRDAYTSFVPHDGGNRVVVVDPLEIDELKYYGFDVFFHRRVGPMRDYFLCRPEMFQKHTWLRELSQPRGCPVCLGRTNELWESDPDTAKTLFPDHRRLIWVLDFKSDDPGQLRLWSCPVGLAEEILAQSQNPSTGEFVDISNPAGARVVVFTRTGTGLTTKYSGVQISEEAVELDDTIADQRVLFSSLLIIPEFEDIEAAMQGSADTPEHAYPGGELPPTDAYDADAGAAVAPGTVGAVDAAAAAETTSSPPDTTQTAEAVPVGDIVSTNEGATDDSLDYRLPAEVTADYSECFCFQHDQWDDCGACPFRELCGGWSWPKKVVPKKKPAPKSKPVAKKKPAPAAKPKPAGAAVRQRADAGHEVGGEANAPASTASAQDAQARLKAAIASRQGKG